MRISDWSSDVCSSDLRAAGDGAKVGRPREEAVVAVDDDVGLRGGLRAPDGGHEAVEVVERKAGIEEDLAEIDEVEGRRFRRGGEARGEVLEGLDRHSCHRRPPLLLPARSPAGARVELAVAGQSTEERRVGKEGVSTCN